MTKKALITGISGQDGIYLSKLLLEKGYQVSGLSRDIIGCKKRLGYFNIQDNIELFQIELTNDGSITNFIKENSFDEIYHLAAQSSVGQSFNEPKNTIHFNTNSTINIIEAVRKFSPKTRVFNASSCEIFGKRLGPRKEGHPLSPISPYALSKVYTHLSIQFYRNNYGLFCSNGILFNHESPLRRKNFFFQKLLQSSKQLKSGEIESVTFGNLDVKRDFGTSEEYVKAMWLILQADKPDDFNICSGESYSLKEIVHKLFQKMEIPVSAINYSDEFAREVEAEDVVGDPSKSKQMLGFKCTKTIDQIIDDLIAAKPFE